MGEARWFSFKTRLSWGGLVALWVVAATLAGGSAVVGLRYLNEGAGLRGRANLLERQSARWESGEFRMSMPLEERRRRRALTPEQLAEEDRVRSDSLRAEAPRARARAQALRREATAPWTLGWSLLLLSFLGFGLAVARTFPSWTQGPAEAGGWLRFIGASAAVLVLEALLMFALLLTNPILTTFDVSLTRAVLIVEIILSPGIAFVAGWVAGRVTRGVRLPATVVGLGGVIVLFAGGYVAMGSSSIDPERLGRWFFGIWLLAVSAAIGLAFFIGHAKREAPAS